jgi:hypothetical protein
VSARDWLIVLGLPFALCAPAIVMYLRTLKTWRWRIAFVVLLFVIEVALVEMLRGSR